MIKSAEQSKAKIKSEGYISSGTISRDPLFDFLYIIIGVPCIFMMIITSRGFTTIKMVLLVGLCVLSFLECLTKKKKFTGGLLVYLLVFVTYSLLSLLNGILRGYEFSFNNDSALIQYFVITPLVVIALAYIFYFDEKRISFLKTFMRWMTLIVVVLDVLKLLSFRGIIPDIDFLNLIMIASSRTESTELTLRVSNEYVLMFLLPLCIVEFFGTDTSKSNRIIDTVVIGFGIVYCLLSGRKSLEIVVFITLICMIFYSAARLNRMKNLLRILLIIILIAIAINYLGTLMGLGSIWNMAKQTLINGLGSDTYAVSYRSRQIHSLTEMWLDSPLIGNGLNSYSNEILANGVTKWSYEVVYNAYLAQNGIIGAGILLSAIISLCRNLIKKYRFFRDDYCLAVLFAFAAFIISGATNPLVYVSWPWAYTFVIANFYRQDDFLSYEFQPEEYY